MGVREAVLGCVAGKKIRFFPPGTEAKKGGLCPFPGVFPAWRRDLSEAVGGRGGAEENGNFTSPKILL